MLSYTKLSNCVSPIDLPDTAALVDLDQAYLKEALVVTLYHVGKLSGKEACLTLGISRRAFEELLPQFGFSILADTPETIDVEPEVASVLEHQEEP